MSKIKLTGDTSGYVEISAPNAAGNNTLELPATGSKLVVSDSSDNLNVAGIVTATTFSGDLTGNVTGNLSSSGVSTISQLNVGTGGTVITTTASGLVGLNSTSPAATIDIRTAPQWSSSNYGADLIIGGSRNNSLGLLDSNNAQPWAIANTGGTLTVATMPNLGDTSTAPTNRMQINSSGSVTKPTQPAFLAYNDSGVSVSGGWNNLSSSLTSETYDIGGNYGTSTAGRFVAPVAGRYLFYAGGWSSGNTTDARYAISAAVNGGSQFYISGGNYSLVDTPLSGYSIIHNLAVNDFVELFYYSAIATQWGGGSHPIYWGGYLLG